MKDLFLLTADADALAFMKSILSRHEALGIRPITFEHMRHPMRDSGVIKDGPETARLYKGKCNKALLLWDHHGSGHEKRHSAEDSANKIQERLDGVTWSDNSGAISVAPELEEWLWHSVPSIAAYFGIEQNQLTGWMNEYATKKRSTVEKITKDLPKELFEFICIDKLKRSISPSDFEEIGKIVIINELQGSESFSKILVLLRNWFPARPVLHRRSRRPLR
jgi:hypothetical protein